MINQMRLAAACLALAALTGSVSRADTITGQVVDGNGVGIGGVDIDVKNLGGGGDPTIFNDGTDPDGFFVTTLPAGFYEVTFTPPQPPASTSLIGVVEDVIVVGTTAMGVITLPDGVALAGHVQDTGALPVAGINIDVIDSSGDNVDLAYDFTDVFGNFNLAVPAGAIELRLDATPVIGSILASQALDLDLSGNTVLPDVTLPPGFTINGVVRDEGGVGIVEVDMDTVDPATGSAIYTPGDDTTTGGLFSFVVPAGTWDFQACPPEGLLLVGEELPGVTVAASTNLGVVTLETGVRLSGTVRDFNGVPVSGADVDVDETVSGVAVLTCRDNTDASGNYSVVVPSRALDVRFHPPSYSMGLGSDFTGNLTPAGATVLNGVLPPCVSPTNYGTGLAGTGGIVPHLTNAGGGPSEGNKGFRFSLQDGLGGSLAVLVLSTQPASFPLLGGTSLVDPLPGASWVIPLTLGGATGLAGDGSATYDPGSLVGFAGFTGYAQFLVRDDGAVKRWAFSEGLQVDVCP